MNWIKFYPNEGTQSITPVPGTGMVPEWYKDTSKYVKSNNLKDLKLENHQGVDIVSISIKLCSPTFDSFTSGYYFLLQEDVLVEHDENGVPRMSWNSDEFILMRIPMLEYPIPPGYHPIPYSFRMSFGVKTSPGTSCLITHPLNRYDLPFLVSSGIVDTDKKMPPADIRFVLKQGFEGIIPKGTPIFQIIPFKRESWTMEIDESIRDEEMWEHEKRRTMLHSYYTKVLQEKKEYK